MVEDSRKHSDGSVLGIRFRAGFSGDRYCLERNNPPSQKLQDEFKLR